MTQAALRHYRTTSTNGSSIILYALPGYLDLCQQSISGCIDKEVKLTVYGYYLWRNPSAVFQGIPISGTPEVLPNMAGISFNLNLANIANREKGVKGDLWVVTRNGSARHPFEVT